MSRLRRTRTTDWIFCLVVFLAGLFALAVGEFSRRYGTTPESELMTLTGKAENATASTVGEIQYLRFTIAGQTVDYSSEFNGYSQVLAAIRRGDPMTIGISTRPETLLPRRGWVPLYTLRIGGQTLLRYEDTVKKGDRASRAPFILSAVLLLLGGWGLFSCYRNRSLGARGGL
jgi:hypothetical protein